jgi:hypothetical protein
LKLGDEFKLTSASNPVHQLFDFRAFPWFIHVCLWFTLAEISPRYQTFLSSNLNRACSERHADERHAPTIFVSAPNARQLSAHSLDDAANVKDTHHEFSPAATSEESQCAEGAHRRGRGVAAAKPATGSARRPDCAGPS